VQRLVKNESVARAVCDGAIGGCIVSLPVACEWPDEAAKKARIIAVLGAGVVTGVASFLGKNPYVQKNIIEPVRSKLPSRDGVLFQGLVVLGGVGVALKLS